MTPPAPDDRITVVIPTSPIPSHPSAMIISAAIASARASLPNSPIIITCDGTEAPNPTYASYVDSLVGRWDNTIIIDSVHLGHVHQSGMLKECLNLVTTPYLLYLEHDWLLLDDIPWSHFLPLLDRGIFSTIKLHASPRISPYYEHMMEDRVMYQSGIPSDRHTDQLPLPVLPFIHTRQWSQNPHLSRTDFYRLRILPLITGRHDFIENLIHGIVASAPWSDYRVAIYNPSDGDMMRVRHLDGKGTRL